MSDDEPGYPENPAEAAARKRVAQARAWQWQAGLSGDLCEHRSATAALQRACDELRLALGVVAEVQDAVVVGAAGR